MKRLLIIAKVQDKAASFFQTQAIRKKLEVKYLLYEESLATIQKFLQNNTFDFIYIRDPFLKLSHKEIRKKLQVIFDHAKGARLIDNLKSPEDVFLEDKWKQYQLAPTLFPQTRAVTKASSIDFQREFVKQRFSSMARGVVFSKQEMKAKIGYIAQEKIEIQEEYRVFSIFGQIISQAMVKSSKKGHDSKVLGQEIVKVNPQMRRFVQQADQAFGFDFVGHDVAVDAQGKLLLLESNRSCYFGAFFRLSGVNLAEVFVQKLLQ